MFRATSYSSSGESIVSIQHLVYVSLCRWPFRVQVRKDLHTKRSPTQSDIYQMLYWYNWFSWWWGRGCSKHVEDWNKYIEKNCGSSWPFTQNHNKIHGQQNKKFCCRLAVCDDRHIWITIHHVSSLYITPHNKFLSYSALYSSIFWYWNREF